MIRQFMTFIYDRRDFYYPKFIGCLCMCLFGILLTRIMDHQMLDWILILCGTIMPLIAILVPFIQWLFEFRNN